LETVFSLSPSASFSSSFESSGTAGGANLIAVSEAAGNTDAPTRPATATDTVRTSTLITIRLFDMDFSFFNHATRSTR